MATRTNMAVTATAQLTLPVSEIEGGDRTSHPATPKPRRRRTVVRPPAVTSAALTEAVQPELVAIRENPVAAAPPAAAPTPSTPVVDEPPRGAFGQWLLRQVGHKQDWIANLAKAAKADPRFPKTGSVDDVRKHLSGLGAEGDMFEALEDAENAWIRG